MFLEQQNHISISLFPSIASFLCVAGCWTSEQKSHCLHSPKLICRESFSWFADLQRKTVWFCSQTDLSQNYDSFSICYSLCVCLDYDIM